MMTKRNVLVLGATGNQGGAVVQSLLNDGHHVVGVTRDVQSPKAQALTAQGVEMKTADFLNKDSLLSIMTKVDTVFAMTTPGWNGDVESEVKQGLSIVDAAKDAGVKHFIFNSVSDANQSTGIGHFDSKYEIEKHLEASGLNYTIVAPVYFIENLFFPYVFDAVKNEGILSAAMPGDTKLQQISVEDIGRFVAMVVGKREEMFGERINIAGDAISGNEMVEVLSKAMRKEIKYKGISTAYLKEQSEEMAKMYDWFNNTGYSANLEKLETYGMMSFEQWANKQDWTNLM